jgi:hypothetical protein
VYPNPSRTTGDASRSPPLRVNSGLQRQHLGERAAVESGGDLAGDAVGGGAQRVVREMRIARRRRRRLVAEKGTENRQAEARRRAKARVGMPVMPSSA